MTKEDFMAHWKRATEETWVLYSHTMAGILLPYISHFHALKATLRFHRGLVLKLWAQELLVMLQKVFGCSLITKLRSILLMGADFNGANKTVFSIRMLANARKHNMLPEEIFSEWNRMADNGTLTKVLAYNIIRQTRRPAGIASVDADNCYERIAHHIASLVFQSFGVPPAAVESMLTTIQEMKFFLCTGFGDSIDYASSTVAIKIQGLCQGNKAALAGWAVASICIFNAHKKKGHGTHFLCPITKLKNHIEEVIYVDNTDLVHFCMHEWQDAGDTFLGI